MHKVNPFKPNNPVSTGMFAGRYGEMVALENGLFQTKHSQPTNFVITGDRGIGKSSLLLSLKHVSCGDVESFEHGHFDFLPVNVVVSDKTDLVTLLRLCERTVSRELGKDESFRKFLANTWQFVQRIRVMDSGISPSEQDTEVELQIDNFSVSLAETCNRLVHPERGERKRDGILFLFDECDNAIPALRLGYFFKTVTEALQRHGCENVMFVLAGLPDTVEKLGKSHESSLRVFSHMTVRELGIKDRHYVIEKGLERANEINSEKTTISDDAKRLIALLSEGYPHFIQQFAYSAFEVNSDGEISEDDVREAAFKKGGALAEIGKRHYASAFYDKIKSDEYRQVLAIMAEKMNAWITKAEIREKFTGNESTLTNALQALTDRKIILKNPSRMGEYRLQQQGFAIWIKLFGERITASG